MFNNYWLALIVTLLIAILWLQFIENLAKRKLIKTHTSRKIIHIGTGLIYILCWLLFPDKPFSRFFAALVPFIITIQFILVGSGLVKDQAVIDSMARSGKREEILKGPLYYGIVFVVITMIFWKDSPIGLISLILLCGGDGIAEIVGRNVAGKKLPWSNRKTIIGSISMFISSLMFSVLYIYLFSLEGVFSFSMNELIPSLIVITFAGTIIESLTRSDIDNLTVPAIAIVLGQLLIVS